MHLINIQANVSLNDRSYVTHFNLAMISTELPVPCFPVQLGYFKTVYMGKLMCRIMLALRLVSKDCWAEIFMPAWQ